MNGRNTNINLFVVLYSLKFKNFLVLWYGTISDTIFLIYIFLNFLNFIIVLPVQSLSTTLCDSWTAAHQASLSFTMTWSLLKLMSIKLVMLSNHLILCRSLLLLPSLLPGIRVFSNELTLQIKWPKYWSFSISPSNEYSSSYPLRLTVLISLLSKGLSTP